MDAALSHVASQFDESESLITSHSFQPQDGGGMGLSTCFHVARERDSLLWPGVRYAFDLDAKRFGHYDPWCPAFGKMVWELRNNHPINLLVSYLLFKFNCLRL